MVRRFKNFWAVLAAGVCAGAALAGPQVGDRVLGEDEIRKMTSGKTFHYTLLGEPRGDEQHYPDGRVTWMLPDGLCMHGVWMVKKEVLCYFYGITRYGCWNVVENDSGFRHSPVELTGEETDSPSVYITRISEEPVSCAPPQLASLQ